MTKPVNYTKLQRKRKYKLHKMFGRYNMDITGKLEFPSLILDNNKLLHTYISNFDLHFLDDFPRSGYIPNTVFKVKIQDSDRIINDQQFQDYLDNYNSWTKVHTIRLGDTGLFVAGWNAIKDHAVEGRVLYPVFAKYGRKFYLKRDQAQELVELYPEYNLLID